MTDMAIGQINQLTNRQTDSMALAIDLLTRENEMLREALKIIVEGKFDAIEPGRWMRIIARKALAKAEREAE